MCIQISGNKKESPVPGLHKQNKYERMNPKVASLWLAIDDVDKSNGAMEVLPCSVQPESANKSVPEDFILNSGGSTKGFDNFNLTLNEHKLNAKGKKSVSIKRGEAEFHSSWTIHRSDPNISNRRRMAWIVRYCPTGTQVIEGIRGAFNSQYPLIPVMGKGVNHQDIEKSHVSLSNMSQIEKDKLYSPCFGNSELLDLLKK